MAIKWILVPFVLLPILTNLIYSQTIPETEANTNVTLSNSSDNKSALITSTTAAPPQPTITTTLDPMLIGKNAAAAVEAEKISSLSIFFVLCVIALGILLIHLMLQTHFQYLPGESF